jgi:hypothetical protein
MAVEFGVFEALVVRANSISIFTFLIFLVSLAALSRVLEVSFASDPDTNGK